MSEFNVKKYELLCMRLAAECKGLAADVPEPGLRAHFTRMAGMWTELRGLPPSRFRDAASVTSPQPPLPRLIACNGLFAALHHVSF
jgi:hypothetical protein